jgi:uncharacterized protein (DUF2147 family)
VLAVAVGALAAASLAAQRPPGPEAVLGTWETAREDDGQWSRVQIRRCASDGERFCGSIVWLSEPLVTAADDPARVGETKLDVNNPDERLRDRPILGLELMHSFRYDEGKWKDGRIYDPKSGKTYRCEMQLTEDGRTLRVRGFIKVAFAKVGRTTEWTRFVEDG